ncbi:hypothetical protein J4N45_04855 [Vibrio sp. SCSIO 43140]|uniref:hypothetical protein n=1 Tax=Vibrio sp. SCSIO 43140 TaxID=2819100 RepID=UPI002074FDDE|nr:hypothetical protein [Vibrio sp. SCSIO 43140]USD61302.1 hypothetical protein J4N45_04855 [Vibrio sp. SCSIO 43140]
MNYQTAVENAYAKQVDTLFSVLLQKLVSSDGSEDMECASETYFSGLQTVEYAKNIALNPPEGMKFFDGFHSTGVNHIPVYPPNQAKSALDVIGETDKPCPNCGSPMEICTCSS